MTKHRNGRCCCGVGVRMTDAFAERGRFRWSGTCPNCGIYVTSNRRRYRVELSISPVEIVLWVVIALMALGLLLAVVLAKG